MHIIEIVDYQIQLTEEAMLMRPIRELWNADRSQKKERFMQLASIIYHMADPRSSYSYLVDEDERFQAILEQEGLPRDTKIDAKVQAAIDCYKQHVITPGTLLLKRSIAAADKLGKFLEDIDLYAEDEKGKPKYPVSTVATSIRQVPQMVRDLHETEKEVMKEIGETGRARGGNESKKAFEDGI